MLKPIDFTVLCFVAVSDPRARRSQDQLAAALGISQSNIHRTLRQLERSDLLTDGTPRRLALHDLIVFAVRHVYPATLGPPARGVLTASAADPLIVGAPRAYVWPFDAGHEFGIAVEPIHRCIPAAALSNPAFHELMSLIDVFRIGRAREREVARRGLDELLGLAT